jgi:hypothetical protein
VVTRYDVAPATISSHQINRLLIQPLSKFSSLSIVDHLAMPKYQHRF